MDQRPILSVIIPTHRRQRYATETARTLAQLLPECEILVCDTTVPENGTDAWQALESKSLPNLKIIKRPAIQPISVVDNFNFSLSQASGEYLAFIGDDDFVDRSILTVCKWAKSQSVEAVRCTFPASYYWPDFKSQYFGDGYAGKISLTPFSGKVTLEDPADALKAALQDLGGGVGKMPRAYLGLISADMVRRIETRHGALFGGVSPDIYSAALIASECRRCASIDYPFIVPGSSGASTSGQSAVGGHKGKLRENDHIRPFGNFAWDARIPEFYSVPSVWSYSLVKAVENNNFTTPPNFGRLLARCFLNHPNFGNETLSALRHQARLRGWASSLGELMLGFGAEFRHQMRRIGRRLLSPKATGDAEVLVSLDTTEAASLALAKRLHQVPLQLPELLAEGTAH